MKLYLWPLFIPSSLRGFYGMIGPSHSNHTRLYDLFTENGIIQGVFIENKTFHFVQHPIQTDKWKWEHQYGKPSNHLGWILFHKCFHQLGLLPNLEGTANTALMKFPSKTLALFERDLPYEMNICFQSKSITTQRRLSMDKIRYFSAHSKQIDSLVYTSEYDFIQKKVKFHQLSSSLDHIFQTITVSTTYIPIVHDFLIHDQSLWFLDSPFEFSFSEFCKGNFPIHLNPQKPSFLIQLDLKTHQIKRYSYDKGICIFHFSKCIETESYIDLYAPIYETMNLNHLHNEARYQKIQIHKNTSNITLVSNPSLQSLNVEFPIQYGNWTILRHLNHHEQRVDRLVICDQLEWIHSLTFSNQSLCGEPIIVPSDPFDLLMVFTNRSLMITRMDTFETEEIVLDTQHQIQLGFHSLWIPFP